MSGLTRVVFFKMLNVHLIIYKEIPFEGETTACIEVDCRYKQAHTLLLRVYTP